jgi:hypothetical protein
MNKEFAYFMDSSMFCPDYVGMWLYIFISVRGFNENFFHMFYRLI